MARYEHLPIYKQSMDVAVHFEKVVAGFYSGRPTLHPAGRAARVQNRSRRFCVATKYTLGTELEKGHPMFIQLEKR